jgi:ABC-type Fe3+ transport system substrate-binding protein
LPDDPGYDVLPAGALPGALPGTQAERPGTPAGLKPRRRLRRWMAAVAGVVLIGGLAYLGLTVFGGDGASREPGAYELVRARALNRARTNPPVTEAKLGPDSPSAAAVPATANPQASPPAAASARSPVEIGIAYGTEKRNWLEWAAQEFAASNAGQHVRVQLIPMGSLESAHAILDGDPRIHVWSPASSLARETLLRDWEAKYQGSPILKEEPLALTPMVLVMWKSRYEAFTAKCPNVSLRTFNYAMRAEGGWATIAGRPAWGRFKFGHTHPNQSNSGLMTLIMLACEFFGKKTGLTVSEIMSPSFQDYLTEFRAGVAGVSHSTGTLMKEMTLKGPTCYDALLVYENLAIEYAESAEGRWDSLQVIYPEHNLWNENPYVILNTPWTTPEHQQAAEEFLAFLLSEPVQTRALDFGFRPANPRVPVKGPNSPFAKYAKYGLAVELPATCDVPSREVMENLQQSWIRCAPARPDGPR